MPKTVELICIEVKISQQMFRVTAVCFHTAIQTFSQLINSVVDNGLLHTGPRGDHTRVWYTNK